MNDPFSVETILQRLASSKIPEAGAAPVQGSIWQFDGSQSTVEFLTGGIVHYNDSDYGGHWSQDRDVVTFDSNNFTMFAVTIEGDRMSGIWYRIRDPQVNFCTGLRRIR
jgi:hypothetical protein